ncbi:MAG: hypothetical protein JNM58_03485 [Xanthomonadaceae bacterium]|nr:hypothetical protein [Xanthomonadaceae bacterium]
MTKIEQVAVPQWTKLSKKRGVDPLGMQNSSVRIYQRLLPGISNVTLRIRYYGLYVWLADRYARDIGDTDQTAWQRRIRRAEALYALIAQVKGGERGVGGAEWAEKRLATAGERRLDFRDDTEPGSDTHYLQNPWGVFGQAYQSQLFAIGLLAYAAEHEIATPAPGVGDKLAQAFAASVGEMGDLFLGTLDRGWTSRKDLDAMSSMAPSSIARGSERDCYQALLLRSSAENDSPDVERRRTLQLILHWAAATGRKPGSDELRWSMYSACLDEGQSWVLPDYLEAHRLRWSVYQANEIAHIALETLLKGLLNQLEAYPAGCSLEQLIAEAASKVRACFKTEPEDWNSFVEAQRLSKDASSTTDANSEWMLTRHSWMRQSQHGMNEAEQCAAAVRALAVVQKRMRSRKVEVVAELSDLDPLGFHSLLTELAFLEHNADMGFEALLQRLFLERVVRRHLWVAMRKLQYHGDYTFLIDTDDGLVRKRGDDGPVWTGPRLGNAIVFLEDIGLLSEKGATERGRRALVAA